MPHLSEDDLIGTYFAPMAGQGGFSLRDDAAALRPPPGRDLVVTKDLLVAGVHFFSNDPPAAIARKALRVNLSDLAAKGAEPAGFFLGLALPEDWTTDWLAAFAHGLGEDAALYACPLLGGDTVRTPGPLTLSITALGIAAAQKMIPRGGVEAGDQIYVTGTIGDAALGLKLRLGATSDAPWIGAVGAGAADVLLDRYLLPQPRLCLRRALAAHAHAAMDISDGLAGDLAKMLRLTGMTIKIALGDIPLSEAAREALRAAPRLIETICTGGDDYEILCAVPEADGAAFREAARKAGIAVSLLGRAVRGKAAPLFTDADGRAVSFVKASHQHF